MRISDWSSDVCSSDLRTRAPDAVPGDGGLDAVGKGQRDAITRLHAARAQRNCKTECSFAQPAIIDTAIALLDRSVCRHRRRGVLQTRDQHLHHEPRSGGQAAVEIAVDGPEAVEVGRRHVLRRHPPGRSEEHTSELQSLMRISYAVFCLKKKT